MTSDELRFRKPGAVRGNGAAPQPPSRGSARPGTDIVERTANFADRVIRVCQSLPANSVGWELGRQLVRAGSSVGANVEEAQAAESRPDFLHKMRIARKECREARYFLIRIVNASLLPARRLNSLILESEELLKVLTSIILSAGRSEQTERIATRSPRSRRE